MELRVNLVFGLALKAERDSRHLTQVEAAEQVGVSTRTWQLWESGELVVPKAKHRRALIDWLREEQAA